MAFKQLTKPNFRALGFLPLVFFLAQGIHYWQINELEHMLWMCNIGNLLLAVGVYYEQPILIRVAALWALPGLIVWLIYVVPTWGLLVSGEMSARDVFGVISSTLAHVGGMSVALVALKKVRMDERAWIYAFVWYLIVQTLSRFVTTPAMNVNLSQRVQDGFEQSFTSYLKFWLLLTAMVAIAAWVLTQLLRRLWPKASEQ